MLKVERLVDKVMVKKEQSNFWNNFAARYDGFITRFASDTYKTIEQLLKEDLQKTDNVLEIGTGTGIIAYAVAGHAGEITAIDSASEMITVAKNKLPDSGISNITFQLGNAVDTGLPEKNYDVVIASNVFHLLEKPELALSEIRRVLKDNGKAILPTYCHGQNIKTRMLSALMGISGFRVANRWSVKSFRVFLENNGFVILREVIIKDKIPLAYIVTTKQRPQGHEQKA